MSAEQANDTRAPQVVRAQTALRLLGEMLEECGYDMAGQVDSIQVARVLSLSHEVTSLAARLRTSDL